MPPKNASNSDDDYVVSLLLKDAESNRNRYLSNSGLGSLLSSSKRSRPNAPKPNTRFLKNIIRDTDSHNAALKAKEEEESRARLREMREGKRKREDEEDRNDFSRKRRSEDRPGRWNSALGGISSRSEREKDRSAGQRHSNAGESERTRHRKPRERSRERRHTSEKRHRSDNSRSRSRSPRHRKERRRRSRSRSHSPSIHKDKAPETHDSDSDPLESFVGPKPPLKILPRGRGAHKSAADSMDTRFDPSYNPKTDVDLSPDEGERDDWDMALKALRDRAKWRTQGAERLRAAGFSEDDVGRWEKSSAFRNRGQSGEKDIEDVRWAKKGEGREWDRGKVMDKEGVDLRPEWGRLKGS